MSRIEDQARYYKNLHLLDRSIIAAVHVENKEDEAFWNKQLQNVKAGHYYFITHSKNEKGSDTSGCEQCLRYREYVSRDFFICIDSDLRLLRGEEDMTPYKYIAQTHTYSWENHCCEALHLQKRFVDKDGGDDFDFVTFLTEFSNAVYKPLCMLVLCHSFELNKLWNVSEFNKCIPLQPSREDVADNGRAYIAKVRSLFEDAIKCLPLPGDFDIEGLSAENAYLHIQGHQLYQLVMHIGSVLTSGKRIRFRTDILDSAEQTSGYQEIDCVKSDLRTILAK